MKTTTHSPPKSRLPFACLVLSAAVFVSATCARSDSSGDEDTGASSSAPQRVEEVNGETVVKLPADEIKRVGLETAVLPAATQRARQHALAEIVDLQTLLDSAATLADAQAQAARAAAELSVSAAEYERLKKLQAGGQGVSIKDLEAARAAWQGDDAANRSAQTAWQVRRAVIEQQWGPVLAGWLAGDSPEFQRLVKGEALLVRVAAPGRDHSAKPPGEAELRRPDKQWVQARLVSASPQAAPEFQSESWLFLADAGGGLLPGMNVEALLPAEAGGAQGGVIVPDPAVVWWQGRAWIFVQTGRGVFTQRGISTDQPEPDGGYFVADFPAGQAVVVRGAQILLSEENKPAPGGD